MPVRTQVYNALDGERDYQDRRWNASTTSSAGKHTVGEYLLFMEHYLNEARRQISTQGEPRASDDALDTIRKITALGVVCMEQNGIIYRQF